MAGMDWFRWHHGSVTDPKFQLVARKTSARVADVIAVWACILEEASQAEERGNPGVIDFESIDCLLGLDDGQAKSIHTAMGDRSLVTPDGRVASWDKRQPKREREDNTNAERQRAFKAKHSQVTPGNATVTPGNAEKHLEESRGDKSREEEIQKTQDSAPTTSLAGAACVAMKAGGVSSVNPSHPKLISLVNKGVSLQQFCNAATEASSRGKGFAYALGIIEGQLADALAPAKIKTSTPQAESFRERDDRLARERIEAICPSIAAKAPRSHNVIDITGTLTETIGAIA